LTSASLVLAIVGPTASGKTSFAVEVAEAIGGEIVCMDSTTIYRGFDIGSSKPSAKDRERIPHHLVDILDPMEPFSAYHFVQQAEDIIGAILGRGKLPIVVGGTYFYLRALQFGMYPGPVIPAEVIESIENEYFDDETLNTKRMHQDLKAKDAMAAQAIHPNDRYRLIRALAVLKTTGQQPSSLKPAPLSEAQSKRIWLKYAMAVSRNALTQAITRRTERLLKEGLVEETRKLQERFPQARALHSIGYAESVQFLQRRLTEKQLRSEIIEKTRQLAKRQITWLRSDPEIRYVDFRDVPRVKLEVDNLVAALQ
jgi:tRNA dimethylallyltransferase